MNLFKRLLAASGAAGLLIGVGGATQALATSPFTAEIALDCVNAGQNQTIRVTTTTQALVHIEVTIGNSTVNGGTQNGTGIPESDGTFTDTWKVADVTATTGAVVRIYVLTLDGVAVGAGEFSIHPANGPCPTPHPVAITGTFIDAIQVGGNVQKACDTGVTGTATFTATIQIKLNAEQTATVTLPADASLPLTCNGASEALPKLPVGSVITLHESVLPTGAATPAADTRITIGTEAVTTTIRNAKAAVVTTPTPTPTPIVLPATGHPASTPSIPWVGLVLLGLIAMTGAGLVLRRRS